MKLDRDYDIGSEKYILCSLTDSQILNHCRIHLPVEAFSERNKIYYKAILSLDDKNFPIDKITLRHEADVSSETFEFDIGYDLRRFSIPTFHFYKYHLDLVLDLYVKREHDRICKQSIFECYAGEKPETIADDLILNIETIRNIRFYNDKIQSVKNLVNSEVDRIDDEAQNPLLKKSGLSTGFPRFDKKLGHYLEGSEIFVLAARPSMGKTSLVMNMVEHLALHQEVDVAIFSIEMSARMLCLRLISSVANVELNKASYTREEIKRLAQAANALCKSGRIHIDDTPSISLESFNIKCKLLKRLYGIKAFAIDYIQLMTTTVKKGSRENELTYISGSIKGVAKDTDTVGFVLAQLNRQNIENPTLANLRESGSIEQDADIVGLMSANEDWTRINIAKNRNGPTNEAFLKFHKPITKFYEPQREYYNPSDD